MQTVRQWLDQLGLPQYAEVFERNAVDLDLLRELTDEDLEKVGVLPLGHRKKLLKAIAELNTNEASAARVRALQNELLSPASLSAAAERRQLTVMFCDLVGSTALSHTLDPEQLRDLMRAYQQASGQVIEKYGGHVAQYLGDGLMVYFGWPQAHEDDGERAVRASLDIVGAVKSVPAAAPLQVRIGIATGPVVVGETGAGDASVPKVAVGETPNLAARLQGLAGADEIVVGLSTQRLLGASFEYCDLGQHLLKGVVEPARAWRVLGVASVEGRFEATREASALTPLVGREEEIRLLLHRWEQTKAGEGQAVLLCGEPGVGKSRILQVLRERIGQEQHTRLRYQCSPFHSNSAFHPLIEQFERAAGFSRDDSADEKLGKMESLLGAGGDNVQSVAPLFAAMLSLPLGRYPVVRLSPQQWRDNTIEAQVAQVLGLARIQPVLFLFEDAHWADPTTLEVLDRLLNRIESACVLIAVTYRPGFVPPWVGQPRVTALTLARLSRREAAELAEKVTGGRLLPPEVLDQIVAKTDGVPRFVEELTKAVIESGLLRDSGDRYQLNGPLPPLAIPSTLQDSLMARLDRLAPIKEVAQIAAAIGREFSYELLAALWTLSTDQLETALEQLVASELVFQRGQPPAATYAFKHALVQDAAYQSILRSRRQQLHARIARALEERFAGIAEEQPELLAVHYDRAAMPEDAVAWYLRAARRAQMRSANREAVNHLEHALSSVRQIPHEEKRASLEGDICANLGTLYITLEGWTSAKAMANFRRANELGEALGNTQSQVLARSGYTLMLVHQGRASEASAITDQLVRLVRDTKDRLHEMLARNSHGFALMFAGRYREALSQWERVLELYDREADAELAFQYGWDAGVDALVMSAYMNWQLGHVDQARRFADASIELARHIGHVFTLAYALMYAGADLSYFMRDPERALLLSRQGEGVAERGGFLYCRAKCAFNHGWSLTRLGQATEGIERMRSALAEIHQLGLVAVLVPRMTAQLAEVYGLTGRADEGLEVLASSPDRAPGRKRSRWAEIFRIEGDLQLAKARPDPLAAEACYREAIEIAIDDEARTHQLRASTSLARLWLSQGKANEALDLLRPIFGSFAEGFGTTDLMEATHVLQDAQAAAGRSSRPAL
jgi:class 3 adenylate cyclase/tetratricopeptide (TPR) repeat protein